MVAVDRKFEFELVSPERLLCPSRSTWRSSRGQRRRLRRAGRPFAADLHVRPGVIEVWQGETVTNRLFVVGGFAEVTDERCTVLAD
jgi:F-type H+-transporting ATPase subunit epsilon